uniref:Uncharacterized protein n=1 Tax=Knipowitschia caucasica TaxID=637954 RepID=A0AAV2KNZ7_KNICA
MSSAASGGFNYRSPSVSPLPALPQTSSPLERIPNLRTLFDFWKFFGVFRLGTAPSPPALFLLMDLGGPANHDPCQPTPSVHAQTMDQHRKEEKEGGKGEGEGRKNSGQML